MKDNINIELLRSLLIYDHDNGICIWRERPLHMFKASTYRSAEHICALWNSKHVGKIAGADHNKGYKTVRINGVPYLLHRVIYAIVTGAWPKSIIDHKDSDRSNNRFENLREASYSQNSQNSKLRADSHSGLKGVRPLRKNSKLWESYLRIDGRRIYIGSFPSREEAHAAYCSASKKHFGEFARPE